MDRVFEQFDGFRTFPPAVGIAPDKSEKGARQSEAAATDINNIVKQYDRTGLLPMIPITALYEDVSNMGDYRSAMEQVRLADQYFMALPAEVRSRFDNDAATFLDFSSDPGNRDELVKLGLLPAPPPVVPPAVAG